MKQIVFTRTQVSDKKRSDNVIWIKTKYASDNSDTQHQTAKVEQILNVLVDQECSDVCTIKWTKIL